MGKKNRKANGQKLNEGKMNTQEKIDELQEKIADVSEELEQLEDEIDIYSDVNDASEEVETVEEKIEETTAVEVEAPMDAGLAKIKLLNTPHHPITGEIEE